jgi:hypothetical protein
VSVKEPELPTLASSVRKQSEPVRPGRMVYQLRVESGER